RFAEDAAVTAISCANGRIAGVRTKADEIGARTVVNAAGPWAAQVAKLAGVDLPIEPLRRHIFVTEAVPGLDEDFPLTIEFASGLYAHRESGGVLLGMDRKSTRLNSSHVAISYAVFCLKKKKT